MKQWPTAVRQWHFELRDVSCRQNSYYYSQRQELAFLLKKMWQFCQSKFANSLYSTILFVLDASSVSTSSSSGFRLWQNLSIIASTKENRNKYYIQPFRTQCYLHFQFISNFNLYFTLDTYIDNNFFLRNGHK